MKQYRFFGRFLALGTCLCTSIASTGSFRGKTGNSYRSLLEGLCGSSGAVRDVHKAGSPPELHF